MKLKHLPFEGTEYFKYYNSHEFEPVAHKQDKYSYSFTEVCECGAVGRHRSGVVDIRYGCTFDPILTDVVKQDGVIVSAKLEGITMKCDGS